VSKPHKAGCGKIIACPNICLLPLRFDPRYPSTQSCHPMTLRAIPNSLDLYGVLSHNLELKAGVPVLLMRKLGAPRLCNGIRLRFTELGRHIVKSTILTGEAKRDNVLIPRIAIIPNNLPFNFKCLQFSLKVQ